VKPSLADYRPNRREASSKRRFASRQRNVSTTRKRYGYAVGTKLGVGRYRQGPLFPKEITIDRPEIISYDGSVIS